MPLFFKEKIINSPINGKLVLRRYLWGKWFLKPADDLWHQSGSYLEKMWRAILKKNAANNFHPKTALVLGAGAGCAMAEIKKIWPNVNISAVDYDPTMLEAAKMAYADKIFADTKFIVNKADAFLSQQGNDAYDLVIIDLFHKSKPSPLLESENFILDAKRIVKNNGLIVLNFDIKLSGDTTIPEIWQKILPGLEKIKYKTNFLLAGYVLKIPPDYYSFQQDKVWANFLRKQGFSVFGEPRSFFYTQHLPFLGFRVVNAPHTDTEPNLNLISGESHGHGIIFWSPWLKQSAPKPWKHWPWKIHSRGSGFTLIRENYLKTWNKRARRSLKKFDSFNLKVGKVDAETFTEGLRRSTLKKSLRQSYASTVNLMDHAPITFWVVRKSNEILGGLSVIKYAEHISAHFIAFITKKGKKFQVGTGLIDYWHRHCLENKIKYLNFGYVRQDGEPKSWQGYTDFKKNFLEQEIILRNSYFRFF